MSRTVPKPRNRAKRRAKAGTSAGEPARILHIQSTFSPGGKELRTVSLINGFGRDMAHDIVLADPDETGASAHINAKIDAGFLKGFPRLDGYPNFAKLHKIAQRMQGYDLVLTYNWGAINAVLARTLFADMLNLPPLIHHEDGFNEDEFDRLKRRRNLYRRIALGRVAALVVPSRRLQDIALGPWQQPPLRVKVIPNGIALEDFTKPPKRDALGSVVKQDGELWLGTMAGLRRVKNLPRLVRAFATMPNEWKLIIVGDGPERDRIWQEAERLGVSDRVELPGFAADPSKIVGLFDIFALSSDSEQFPISVVEAMAAGAPVVAPNVGDVANMVSYENAPYITPAGDEVSLASTLTALAEQHLLRRDIGDANRKKAMENYELAGMIDAYRRLYEGAMHRAG